MDLFDSEVSAIASDFWARSGVDTSFPRSLEPAVFLVLPLAVVRLPRLRLLTAIKWLNWRGIAHRSDAGDRHLHGYLIARGGAGIVFLDGTDPYEEQLFSLAHEIAHFLYDYLRPRTAAIRVLGTDIGDVLDGLRPPTPEERLTGILRGVPVGTFTHIGRRSNWGLINQADFLHIENRADQLALELLAPLVDVVTSARSRVHSPREGAAHDAVVSLLREQFSLPGGMADIFARTVLSALRSRQSFREWLDS